MFVQSGGMAFDMPTGRLDGMISSVQDASDNLPGTTLSAKEMTQQFAQHGLTQDEMVTLAGKSRVIIITIASTYSVSLGTTNSNSSLKEEIQLGLTFCFSCLMGFSIVPPFLFEEFQYRTSVPEAKLDRFEDHELLDHGCCRCTYHWPSSL